MPTNSLSGLAIGTQLLDPLVVPLVEAAVTAITTVADLASILEPVVDPALYAASTLANAALDAAVNPIAEPLITLLDASVTSLDPALGAALAELLAPATGQLHLPATGDLLTPVLGGASFDSSGVHLAGLLSAAQGEHATSVDAESHATLSLTSAVPHLLDVVSHPEGMFDLLHS